MSDFQTERTIKSKKRRRCTLSSVWIEVGEPHLYVTGSYEGDFYSVRFHPSVYKIYQRRNQKCWTHGDGLPWDEFLDDIIEAKKDPNRDSDAAAIMALPGHPEWFRELFERTNQTS